MAVTPNEDKISKLMRKIDALLINTKTTIREAASVLGLMKDMCKGGDYGLAHVKFLEVDKSKSLKRSGSAQFDGRFFLSNRGRQDLTWWQQNARLRPRMIRAWVLQLF